MLEHQHLRPPEERHTGRPPQWLPAFLTSIAWRSLLHHAVSAARLKQAQRRLAGHAIALE
jgi:hypothetical protein